MSETITPRLQLTGPTPGTSEAVDVADHLNANWAKLDAVIGCTVCTSGTRPGAPFDGQIIRETDTRRMYIWNATQAVWDQVVQINAGITGAPGLGVTAAIRLYCQSAAAANRAVALRGSGDTVDRYAIDYDGLMQWGSGAGATDVTLFRQSAGKLRLGGQMQAGTSVPADVFLSTTDTSTSTSYVALTTHGMTFVAPPSGAVWINVEGALGTASTSSTEGSYMSYEVRQGGTIGSGTIDVSANDQRSAFSRPSTTAGFKYTNGHVRRMVTGLTAGNTYNVRTMVRTSDAAHSAAVNNRYLCVEPIYSL